VAAYDPAVRAFWAAQLERFYTATEKRLRQDQKKGRLDPRLVTQPVAEDDGSGDAAIARELADLQWYGAFRRPNRDGSIKEPS
jgi:hypothetical protein